MSIIDDLDTKDFSNDVEGFSLLAISHQKLEADRFLNKYRFQKRKFLENIYGEVNSISGSKYRVQKNFISAKAEELSALKVLLETRCLYLSFRSSSIRGVI